MTIRAATFEDADVIADIYAPYVTDSFISFEETPPDAAEVARRMGEGAGRYPWVALEEGGTLLGYAYASNFRGRHAYRFTVETSVYLRRDALGRGFGAALYGPLLDLLTAQGFTAAIGGIALPNDASVRLHERLGFRHLGTFERVGWKFGAWHDVGMWQRELAPRTDAPREPRPWREVASALG
jgi:phosphinothricin acetyltransferase